MQRNSLLIILTLLLAGAFYFLGKKNGASDVKVSMVENVEMIKQIAELAALNISGNVKLKISNKDDAAGAFSKFKNFLTENTLLVTLPYEAKFGVDMSNQKVNVDTKSNVATIYLPHCKLMSLQLKMDNMETMTQTGMFASASMDDLVNAQKQLYTQALQNIEKNDSYITLSEKHINEIMQNYYKPLGYSVNCVFGNGKGLQ